MALIYLDIKQTGKRKRRHDNQACFSALNHRKTRIESVTYWVYPLTTSMTFEGQANIYLRDMAKVFPYFPPVKLADIMRKGFTITDTDKYPGMYANFLLRLVRPMQEKPNAIQAYANWAHVLNSYSFKDVLRQYKQSKLYNLVESEDAKVITAFILSQQCDVSRNGGLARSELPRATVHEIFDNGIKRGGFWKLLTVKDRLNAYPSFYDSGVYWYNIDEYTGPEAFVIGGGYPVSLSDFGSGYDDVFDFLERIGDTTP